MCGASYLEVLSVNWAASTVGDMQERFFNSFDLLCFLCLKQGLLLLLLVVTGEFLGSERLMFTVAIALGRVYVVSSG